MAGFLGKTKVEEVRRSARAKIHCIFYRDFKTWSFAILRKKTDRKNEERMQQLTQNLQTQQQPIHLQMKQTPQKVDGAIRLEMMSEWMDLQYEAIEAARKSLGTERMKSIIRDINDPKDKSSAEDNAAKLSKYKRAIKSTKNRLVDSKHLCDVTPWMEGSIILSYLTGSNKARDFLMAEIKHRDIKLPSTNSKKIPISKWQELNEMELRHELRDHERARLEKEENKVFASAKDVKYIKPLSDKMREWMPKQWQIYKKKKGLIDEDSEANA
jgi:hypothetical protein